MANEVWPYFVASDDTVIWHRWELLDGDSWVELPDCIEGWDPGTDLRVARSFQIDREKIQRETGLSPTELAISISWKSDSTNMVEAESPKPLPDSGVGRLHATLRGQRLGGTLELRSRVVFLGLSDKSHGPGIAKFPGSIIAEDRTSLVLERPTAKMFPVQVIDFARTPYDPAASWHIEIRGDLEAPFLGTTMLMVNSRDTQLCAAATNPNKDVTQQLLYEELEAGVAQVLLTYSISLREELIGRSFPADSLGASLLGTLENAGFTESAIPDDPTEYQSRLQASVRRMGFGRMFD